MAKSAAQIVVELIDRASGPAKKIAASLREIQGLRTTSATRKLEAAQRDLGKSMGTVTARFGPQATAAAKVGKAMQSAAAPAKRLAETNHDLARGATKATAAISKQTRAEERRTVVRERAAMQVERAARRARYHFNRGVGGGSDVAAPEFAPHPRRRPIGPNGGGTGGQAPFLPGQSGAHGSGRSRTRPQPAETASGRQSMMPPAAGVVGAYVGYQTLKAGIRETVGEAISFEKAMAEVKKKVDAPSPEAFGDLEKGIKKTSKDLGIAQNEVAELTAEAGASGIAFGDLGRFIKLASKASVGWDMTPRETSQKLAEIKAAGNLTIGEMETLGDKINALGDNSAAKERNIVEMFSRSGAAAKEAGVDYDTTLALLTSVNSAGMQPEIASRWFNAFSGALRTVTKDDKNMVAGLKLIGLTAEQVSEGMKRDAGKTMTDLFDRLTKSPEAATAAIKMFGKGWWDETLRAKGASAEVKKQMELVKDSARFKGSLDKGLAIQLDTTANHLVRLKSLSEDVGDRMGRWTLKPINQTIESVLAGVDNLEQRLKVLNAGKSPAAETDETGRFVRSLKDAGGKVIDFALDKIISPAPTADPSRGISASRAEIARDKKALAEKYRAEAVILDEQRKKASKSDKKLLTERAAKLRLDADTAESEANGARRTAGVAGARDMTEVEVGEAAAGNSIRLMRRAAEIEKTLAAGRKKLPNGLMGGGIGDGEREELTKERDKIRAELSSAKTETTPAAELPSMNVPLPPPRPASVDRGKPPEVTLPEQAVTAAPQARATPLPPPRPPEMSGGKPIVDKAEIEAADKATGDLKTKLDGVGATAVSPRVDASQLDAVKPKADEAKAAMEGLNVTATPSVNTSSLDAYLAKLREAIGLQSKLGAIPGAGGGAGAAARGLDRSRQTSMESSPS